MIVLELNCHVFLVQLMEKLVITNMRSWYQHKIYGASSLAMSMSVAMTRQNHYSPSMGSLHAMLFLLHLDWWEDYPLF